MTHDCPPSAHFHLPKCAISRYALAGKILVTRDFDSRARPFGSKQRDARCTGLSFRVKSLAWLQRCAKARRNLWKPFDDQLLFSDANYYNGCGSAITGALKAAGARAHHGSAAQGAR